MAITVKNMIVNGQDVITEPPAPTPKSISVVLQEKQTAEANSDHPVLIVDGKPKKVVKKSAYLLDMLTIEEDL